MYKAHKTVIYSSMSKALAAMLTLCLIELPCSGDLISGPFLSPQAQAFTSAIPSEAFGGNNVTETQHQTEWCWAASIATIFAYYKHPFTQEEIVETMYGKIENFPAQPDIIIRALTRTWKDDNNVTFKVTSNSFAITPSVAAEELNNNRPLIIGYHDYQTPGHAVVLTAESYVKDILGNIIVQSATVRDPWPGMGKRPLRPDEWYGIMFAATISVETQRPTLSNSTNEDQNAPAISLVEAIPLIFKASQANYSSLDQQNKLNIEGSYSSGVSEQDKQYKVGLRGSDASAWNFADELEDALGALWARTVYASNSDLDFTFECNDGKKLSWHATHQAELLSPSMKTLISTLY